MNQIPVLGVPVLNRPDLLEAMLHSIDVPIGRLVIVDNGKVTGDIGSQYWTSVTEPPANLGVAASWNFIIKTTPAAPWWCLVNADVEFAPGDLARLAAAMDEPGPRIAMLVEFAAFGISADCIDAVGWFDEMYHPIYAEDTDYRYRCKLAGVPVVKVPAEAAHLQSASVLDRSMSVEPMSVYGTRHIGSVCYRGNSNESENARTYPQNVAYYRAKWGGWMGEETFTTPFNMGGSWADWRLDRARLAELAWR